MTGQEHLERAYRRLLACYPREFRRENGPEILAVLLAGAPDGQRPPGLAEAAGKPEGSVRMPPPRPRQPGRPPPGQPPRRL